MVATNCAVCHLPLLDAKSVELGIGPICRKKFGFDMDCKPKVREEANQIVHDIAVDPYHAEHLVRITRLKQLGFIALAEKILAHVLAVTVSVNGDFIAVNSKYNPDFVDKMRRIRGTWDKDGTRFNLGKKVWVVDVSHKAEVWLAIRQDYAGQVALVGGAGIIRIGDARWQ
jgi:hypothetical protein